MKIDVLASFVKISYWDHKRVVYLQRNRLLYSDKQSSSLWRVSAQNVVGGFNACIGYF